jgi:hypothetical protein
MVMPLLADTAKTTRASSKKSQPQPPPWGEISVETKAIASRPSEIIDAVPCCAVLGMFPDITTAEERYEYTVIYTRTISSGRQENGRACR